MNLKQLNYEEDYIKNTILPILFKKKVLNVYAENFIYLEGQGMHYNADSNEVEAAFVFPDELYTTDVPRSKCLNAPEASILSFQLGFILIYTYLYKNVEKYGMLFHEDDISLKNNGAFNPETESHDSIVVKENHYLYKKTLFCNASGLNKCRIKMDSAKMTSKGMRLECSGSIGNDREIEFSIVYFLIDENIHT